MEKTATGLVKWAENAYANSWVYWYGTCCYACTEALLKSKTRQYPTHYKDSRQATYKKHITAGKTCTDCVGLIKGYYWEQDGAIVYERDGLPDKSASGMYRAAKVKGKIADGMPEVPGLLVWTKTQSHVGVYVGSGYVIEARGFSYGVQCNKLTDRGFTHWGYCPYIEYGAETASGAPAEKAEQEPAQSAGAAQAGQNGGKSGVYEMKTLREGDKGTQVRVLQWRLTDLGYACGKIDNVFGPKTKKAVQEYQRANGLEADGIAGPKTWAKLMA